MSRRHFLTEIFNMTYDDLRKLYVRLGTVQKVADHFGVSLRTVKNWMKEGGIEGHAHLSVSRRPEFASKFVRWVREHPGVTLPRSARDIAIMTGIPQPAITAYLHRRRQKVLRQVEALPALTGLNVVLKDRNGSYVPTASINCYAYKVDLYSLKVLIYGERRTGGVFSVLLPYRQFIRLMTRAPTVSEGPSVSESHPAP